MANEYDFVRRSGIGRGAQRQSSSGSAYAYPSSSKAVGDDGGRAGYEPARHAREAPGYAPIDSTGHPLGGPSWRTHQPPASRLEYSYAAYAPSLGSREHIPKAHHTSPLRRSRPSAEHLVRPTSVEHNRPNSAASSALRSAVFGTNAYRGPQASSSSSHDEVLRAVHSAADGIARIRLEVEKLEVEKLREKEDSRRRAFAIRNDPGFLDDRQWTSVSPPPRRQHDAFSAERAGVRSQQLRRPGKYADLDRNRGSVLDAEVGGHEPASSVSTLRQPADASRGEEQRENLGQRFKNAEQQAAAAISDLSRFKSSEAAVVRSLRQELAQTRDLLATEAREKAEAVAVSGEAMSSMRELEHAAETALQASAAEHAELKHSLAVASAHTKRHQELEAATEWIVARVRPPIDQTSADSDSMVASLLEVKDFITCMETEVEEAQLRASSAGDIQEALRKRRTTLRNLVGTIVASHSDALLRQVFLYWRDVIAGSLVTIDRLEHLLEQSSNDHNAAVEELYARENEIKGLQRGAHTAQATAARQLGELRGELRNEEEQASALRRDLQRAEVDGSRCASLEAALVQATDAARASEAETTVARQRVSELDGQIQNLSHRASVRSGVLWGLLASRAEVDLIGPFLAWRQAAVAGRLQSRHDRLIDEMADHSAEIARLTEAGRLADVSLATQSRALNDEVADREAHIARLADDVSRMSASHQHLLGELQRHARRDDVQRGVLSKLIASHLEVFLRGVFAVWRDARGSAAAAVQHSEAQVQELAEHAAELQRWRAAMEAAEDVADHREMALTEEIGDQASRIAQLERQVHAAESKEERFVASEATARRAAASSELEAQAASAAASALRHRLEATSAREVAHRTVFSTLLAAQLEATLRGSFCVWRDSARKEAEQHCEREQLGNELADKAAQIGSLQARLHAAEAASERHIKEAAEKVEATEAEAAAARASGADKLQRALQEGVKPLIVREHRLRNLVATLIAKHFEYLLSCVFDAWQNHSRDKNSSSPGADAADHCLKEASSGASRGYALRNLVSSLVSENSECVLGVTLQAWRVVCNAQSSGSAADALHRTLQEVVAPLVSRERNLRSLVTRVLAANLEYLLGMCFTAWQSVSREDRADAVVVEALHDALKDTVTPLAVRERALRRLVTTLLAGHLEYMLGIAFHSWQKLCGDDNPNGFHNDSCRDVLKETVAPVLIRERILRNIVTALLAGNLVYLLGLAFTAWQNILRCDDTDASDAPNPLVLQKALKDSVDPLLRRERRLRNMVASLVAANLEYHLRITFHMWHTLCCDDHTPAALADAHEKALKETASMSFARERSLRNVLANVLAGNLEYCLGSVFDAWSSLRIQGGPDALEAAIQGAVAPLLMRERSLRNLVAAMLARHLEYVLSLAFDAWCKLRGHHDDVASRADLQQAVEALRLRELRFRNLVASLSVGHTQYVMLLVLHLWHSLRRVANGSASSEDMHGVLHRTIAPLLTRERSLRNLVATLLAGHLESLLDFAFQAWARLRNGDSQASEAAAIQSALSETVAPLLKRDQNFRNLMATLLARHLEYVLDVFFHVWQSLIFSSKDTADADAVEGAVRETVAPLLLRERGLRSLVATLLADHLEYLLSVTFRAWQNVSIVALTSLSGGPTRKHGNPEFLEFLGPGAALETTEVMDCDSSLKTTTEDQVSATAGMEAAGSNALFAASTADPELQMFEDDVAVQRLLQICDEQENAIRQHARLIDEFARQAFMRSAFDTWRSLVARQENDGLVAELFEARRRGDQLEAELRVAMASTRSSLGPEDEVTAATARSAVAAEQQEEAASLSVLRQSLRHSLEAVSEAHGEAIADRSEVLRELQEKLAEIQKKEAKPGVAAAQGGAKAQGQRSPQDILVARQWASARNLLATSMAAHLELFVHVVFRAWQAAAGARRTLATSPTHGGSSSRSEAAAENALGAMHSEELDPRQWAAEITASMSQELLLRREFVARRLLCSLLAAQMETFLLGTLMAWRTVVHQAHPAKQPGERNTSLSPTAIACARRPSLSRGMSEFYGKDDFLHERGWSMDAPFDEDVEL